ncbi:MAG: hypothetical protein A2Z14_00930 [Chloroflexi bacterium RBG_16_48_8]|nr:MAG: hypothetical protein A2Z14_00930 [Chloroflexi bacterium RBG_16_48_8]
MMKLINWIGDWTEKFDHRIAIVLFLVNFFLVFAIFLPNLSDINPWDEAAYVSGGQKLMDGGAFPAYAGNPLTSVFFGLTYLPFRTSPYWMVQSISLARVLLFSLLWIGTYLVGRELSDFAPPKIALGIFFVTPLAIEMLRFPSDPLFASFAALSLWQLLKYKHSGNRKHIILSSSFMGLAALARNDGLSLFMIFILLVLLLSLRRRDLWRSLLCSLTPFFILVGGYILLYGLATGDFSSGTMERTYQNFESGQQVVYSGEGDFSPVIESRLEAQRLFGTAEENQNSVFKAIRRNPQEYIRRLIAATKGLPQLFLHAYGIRFALILFLLAFRGVVELARRKEVVLILILILWPMHLLTGFVITLFRTGHLQFPYYVVFALSSIGLFAILSNLRSRIEIGWLTLFLAGSCVYGILDNKLAIFYGAAVFLLSLWILYLYQSQIGQQLKASMFLLLLCAGIIIRGEFPSPKIRTLGSDPKEQAVTFMMETFPSDATIAAGAPGVVWAAKMGYAGLASGDVPREQTSQEFLQWLGDQGIEAIYVDHDLYIVLPVLWNLIEPQIGNGLERVFEVDRGNYQILIFKP